MIVIILLALILLLLLYFFIIKPLFMSQVLTHYHFRVEWGGTNIGFTEVSGLDIEVEAIEHRNGSSPVDSVAKIPGLRKYANITLKRNISAGDSDFFDWINTKLMSTIERRDVVISLLDQEHTPVITWRARNAFPIQYRGPVLQSCDGGIATETLVLAHEGLIVENV